MIARGALAALALLLVLGGAARAHPSSIVYSDVRAEGRQVDYTFQVADSDLYEALGLERDRPATRAEALAGKGRVGPYLAGRVVVENNGLPCPGRPEESALLDRT